MARLSQLMTTANPTRIEILRQTALDVTDKKVLDDVEKFGWSVMHIRPDHAIPGWSFTIGLCETLKQPELIVVGLNEDLAHSVLKRSCRALKTEHPSRKDGHREPELLASVDCIFKRIEQRWLRQAMGFATWFNGTNEFPVFQIVYPDLANRFPWEGQFDETWRDRHPTPIRSLASFCRGSRLLGSERS